MLGESVFRTASDVRSKRPLASVSPKTSTFRSSLPSCNVREAGSKLILRMSEVWEGFGWAGGLDRAALSAATAGQAPCRSEATRIQTGQQRINQSQILTDQRLQEYRLDFYREQ